jgi:hypothetical protein
MKTRNHWLHAGALLLAQAWASSSLAAELKLPRDGWASWQVDAVEGAPDWCCFSSWKVRDASRLACKLDSRDGFNIGGRDTTTDTMKVYARVIAGRIDRVQILSSTCPVETSTPITELGVAMDDSVRWLTERARQDETDGATRRSIGESALAALAVHRGGPARDAMVGFARNDGRAETRKQAVFWLAMLRGAEGADITTSVMFNDQDAEVRKHAAFAITQSKSPRVAAELVRLGNTDKEGEVRAQAWFWLAQTGAPEAEQAIGAALRKDADDDVREQAIFALSQLPEERATRALIAAAEDQSLSREQRKRAVFWLSQSESNSAQAYLEKVLARNAAE